MVVASGCTNLQSQRCTRVPLLQTWQHLLSFAFSMAAILTGMRWNLSIQFGLHFPDC